MVNDNTRHSLKDTEEYDNTTSSHEISIPVQRTKEAHDRSTQCPMSCYDMGHCVEAYDNTVALINIKLTRNVNIVNNIDIQILDNVPIKQAYNHS